MNNIGLTKKEVTERINKGLTNIDTSSQTKSIKEIVCGNIFTYFNILNIALGAAIIIVGVVSGRLIYSLKNCLFLGVMICNTLISILQEIMSKKTIDKLSLLTSVKPEVIRDGEKQTIEVEEIVLDDVMELMIGSQVMVDSTVIEGIVEVNESFITGESKTITKKPKDELLSGSFIVSGKCFAKVIHVGKENYINILTNETKKVEHNRSIIFNSFEKLVRILSYILIPLGIALFINQYKVVGSNLADAIINTTAALVGMIPEGLVLLTSSVMAVSVIKLSKYQVLVQQLYCIETLARVNVICLDKTGTLTTGNMHLVEILPRNLYNKQEMEKIIIKIMNVLPDNSNTIKAVRDYYNEKIDIKADDLISFSSERKFSACYMNGKAYYIGAPEYVLKYTSLKVDEDILQKQDNYRVLIIATNDEKLDEKPKDLVIVGYLIIEDEIRKEAKDTLDYFKTQKVAVKIISGDNYQTVLKIANRVGLDNIKGIDTTTFDETNIDQLVLDNDIFGRVTPQNKKKIVSSLKKQGYIVAMTGDGVNDVLALREADCSVAMASGSDAAKVVSQLVLLDSNFSSMPRIVAEGRKTINNIERSASLLLVKTIYTFLLILTCIFFNSEYFFIPIQLTLITSCTIGIPSFILALEPNDNLVEGNKFLFKIIKKSLPGSLTVFINIIFLLLLEKYFNLNQEEVNSLAVFLTATIGFIHLYRVSQPFNWLRSILFVSLILIFCYGAIFQNEFFNLLSISPQIIIIYILLFVFSLFMYHLIEKVIIKISGIKISFK